MGQLAEPPERHRRERVVRSTGHEREELLDLRIGVEGALGEHRLAEVGPGVLGVRGGRGAEPAGRRRRVGLV